MNPGLFLQSLISLQIASLSLTRLQQWLDDTTGLPSPFWKKKVNKVYVGGKDSNKMLWLCKWLQ